MLRNEANNGFLASSDHISNFSTFVRLLIFPVPSKMETKVIKCFWPSVSSYMLKQPIFIKTLPLTYLAKGGVLREDVTMMSPNCPALYSLGRLV